LDQILATFDSGILVENRPITGSGSQKSEGQRHLSYNPGTSQHRHINAKSQVRQKFSDFFEGGKRIERPLSLLLGGPIEENSVTSRRRISGSKVMRDSIGASWGSELHQVLNLHDNSAQPAFQHSRQIGKGIQSSFQLQSMPFPWEKSIHWEGSSNDKVKTIKNNPLSVRVISNESSFWTLLRAHPCAARLNQFMDSKYWACLIIPAVVIALFSHNVIKAFFPKAADPYLTYIYLICLCLFIFEVITLSIVRKDYFMGLSFWYVFIPKIVTNYQLPFYFCI
jgi:hypothetical protein